MDSTVMHYIHVHYVMLIVKHVVQQLINVQAVDLVLQVISYSSIQMIFAIKLVLLATMEILHQKLVSPVMLLVMDALIVQQTVLNVQIPTIIEKLGLTNVQMIVEQAIMEILTPNFALYAQLAVKLVEQQVLIVLNANLLLECPIIYMKPSVL